MKILGRILIVSLALLLIPTYAYAALSWDYSWSSSDDGSSWSGSDIEDIQDNIDAQVPTLAGDNTLTGTNTFSGTTTFTGGTTGIDAAKDAITRGFELEWGTKEQVIIRVGTLYHGTTRVDKTANVHLDITTVAHYITGASQQATSDWLYVYVDSSGNCKLDNSEPDKSDASGDTEGTLIYYYYSTGTKYYRCIGAIYLNATGSGEIDNFFQRDTIVMWDVPIVATTTLSVGAWSGHTAMRMPSISEYGIFGLQCQDDAGNAGIGIRPAASTWTTANTEHVYAGLTGVTNTVISDQRTCATNSSQEIQYYNESGDSATSVSTQGYILRIR